MILAFLLIVSIALPPAMAAGTGSGPSVWEIETVDKSIGDNTTTLKPSLVWGKDGTPQISYYDGKGGIRYAKLINGKWATKTVAPTWGTLSTSMALDAAGNPAIVYGNGLHFGNLMYTSWNGSKWSTGIVDNGDTLLSNIGQHSSLAFDSAGVPHIAYNNGNHFAALQYVTRNGTSWDFAAVDGSTKVIGDTGYDPSLVMDPAGLPFIAYRDGKHYGTLMAAHLNASGTWEIATVDAGSSKFSDTGYMPSVALDADGRPHISYYDADNGDLRFASWDGAKWILETLDEKGDVGAYSSLAIDSHNQPYISYYDATKQTLRFTTKNPATQRWIYWTIDEGNVGTWSSLALDPLGHPSVVYYDAAIHALKYAGWTWIG
ncbi:MAG: hypothetical protein M0Q92_12655 [Methanoregula sp.]|nr:hypothetical protein [Methanoregula sp.]